MRARILVLSAAVVMTGCIHHEETIVRDANRRPVEFENDTAARIFYEALSKKPASRNQTESKTEVHLPIIFDHKQRVVSGENAKFNEAVEVCDTNKDARITEAEARIYAAKK